MADTQDNRPGDEEDEEEEVDDAVGSVSKLMSAIIANLE